MAELAGGEKHIGKAVVPSPQESGKGQESKRAIIHVELRKEDAFHRLPTDDEVQLGKHEGIRESFKIIRNRYPKQPAGPEDGGPSIKAKEPKKKRPTPNSSRDSDEESARTSSDEEEGDDMDKESSDSSSSGSGETNSYGSDESDREEHEVQREDDKTDAEEGGDGEDDSFEAATSYHNE